MIRTLTMERFKCFERLVVPLSPLTLFTGFNAAGKSTALQTLLLLAQTIRSQRGASELRLKGSLANLGLPADVISRTSGGNQIALGLKTDEIELLWRFKVADDTRRALKVSEIEVHSETTEKASIDATQGIVSSILHDSYPATFKALERLIFLSGTRQVETDLYPVPEDTEGYIGDVGPIGQFAPWWFYQEADNPVSPLRSFKLNQEESTVRHQVNAWAEDIFPGIEFNSLPIPGTSQMRLEMKSGPTSGWTRPSNIGYGISYAFPTLTSALTAPQGCTLIIDSPEAHLHPRGQAQMGVFLAKMASAGIQILIETHSDHLMDGVRIAIREGILSPQDATFHYFTRNDDAYGITTPQIDDEGRLSEWPNGFFDQHRRNMARLVKPRAR